MSSKKIPIFNCTQAELYAVCRIILRSFLRQIDVFSSRKALYSSAYATTALAELDAAIALPESPARKSVVTTFRIQLTQAMLNCVMSWKHLISYVATAYSEEFTDAYALSAGIGHLDGARNENWEEVNLLMAAGLTFMTENETDLEANSNMPTTFITEYTNSKDNFAAIYGLFTDAIEAGRQKTKIKNEANNTLYKKTKAICKDGQLYFASDDALKAEFVFDTVLAIVSSPGNAGLTGVISSGASGSELPIAGVTLSLYSTPNLLIDADYITTSIDDGSYDFGGIASGSYTLKMECTGFVTKMEVVVIAVGVSSGKDFTLVSV